MIGNMLQEEKKLIGKIQLVLLRSGHWGAVVKAAAWDVPSHNGVPASDPASC